MNSNLMKYEERIIAFIDILGFKVEVEDSERNDDGFDHILETLTELKVFFLQNMPANELQNAASIEFNVDTQVIQISDSLIISRLLSESGGVYKMLTDCAYATHLLISKGFLCRGAVKFGAVYHRDTTIFGPAYQKAYEAEGKQSLPVIAFEKDLLDLIYKYPGPANKGIEQWEYDFVMKGLKKLEDGTHYIDYFTDYDFLIGGGEGASTEHYEKLRNIILRGLQLPEATSAYKKNQWAAEQFNLTAEYFDLDPISYND